MIRCLPLVLVVVLAGCEPTTAPAPEAPEAAPTSQPTSRPSAAEGLATEVAAHHGAAAWREHDAVQAKLRVQFGERPPLEGTLTMAVHEPQVRLELADGKVLVFDGEQAWASPEAFPRARFHLLTWPYFLAAPFKLADPGSALEPVGEHALTPDGDPLRCAHLTFDAGVGDTPDDWYDAYVEADGTLAALGYIVTYGKSVPDASKAPHAAVYEDNRRVDGVLISHRWRFYDWTREGGISGDPLGEATLSDVRFVTPDPDAFVAPEGAVVDALPE